MAMFREHVAIGAIISMIVVVLVYFYALIVDPWLLLILFGITVIGSFLPDIDSDSGIPFYLVYGGVTLAATGVVLFATLAEKPEDWRVLVGVPAAALLFFWFVVGGILKKWTHHRGIFHSLPATAVAGLGTLLIARYVGLDETTAIIFGAAMAIGFASHLFLDEMHSGITLDGIPFIPKKSLGTALKLFSKSNKVNMATYLVLVSLAFTAFVKTPSAEAYFYNDSEIIEVGSGVPKSVTGGTPAVTVGGYYVLPSLPIMPSGNEIPNVVVLPPPVVPNVVPPVSPAIQTPTTPVTQPTVTAVQAIELLLSRGALIGASLLTKEGFFEDALLAGLGQGGFGFGTMLIYGSRVRASLSGISDLGELLANWRAGRTGPLTGRGYGLIAASTALHDSNVQSISFSATAFEITYRSRGYFFGLFPGSFPVRVSVIPEASSGRVHVRLPWYRFVVREFFTRSGLEAEIDAVIVLEISKNTKPESDLKAVLFEAVAQFLRNKVGTISDSMYLGTK